MPYGVARSKIKNDVHNNYETDYGCVHTLFSKSFPIRIYLNTFHCVDMQLKNDFDADKFNLDENAVDAHLQLLSIPWKVICIKVIWIGNGLDIQAIDSSVE